MKKIPCEVYTRVVGYFRPVQNMNEGKIAEYKDRVEFCEKDSLETRVPLTEPGKTATKINILAKKIENPSLRYEIYTLPNCSACTEIKGKLKNLNLEGKEFDLSHESGLNQVRKIYKENRDRIARNEDGSLPVPLVFFYDETNQITRIAQKPEDIEKTA